VGWDPSANDEEHAGMVEEAQQKLEGLIKEEQLVGVRVFSAIDKDHNQILTKRELSALFLSGAGTEVEKIAQSVLDNLSVRDPKDEHIELREWLHFCRTIKHSHGSAEFVKLLGEMEIRAASMKVEAGASKWREDGEVYQPKGRPLHTTQDDSNQLSRAERAAALTLFRQLDRDGNELLTKQEVMEMCASSRQMSSEEHQDEDLAKMWNAMEENDDGRITLGEWLHFARRIKRGEIEDLDSGSAGLSEWLIVTEGKVIKTKEDHKMQKILNGDIPSLTKPLPTKVPGAAHFKGSKLYSPKERRKLQQWQVRQKLLAEQMEEWRKEMTKEAFVCEGEIKAATLSKDQRTVGMAIMEHLDDGDTQRIQRAQILDLFGADTASAAELFGGLPRLLTPIYKPSGLVISDWFEFLMRLKGERGNAGLDEWLIACGLRMAKRMPEFATDSSDLGFKAILSTSTGGLTIPDGDATELDNALTAVRNKRMAALEDLERVALEKKAAKSAQWEKEQDEQEKAARARASPAFQKQQRAALGGSATVPLLSARSKSVPLKQRSPQMEEAMKSGIHAKSPPLPPVERTKHKLKKRARKKFLLPSPLLPSRLQLSPLASHILAPRSKPFTDEEVGMLTQHVHQKQGIGNRHANDPLLLTRGGSGTWSTPSQY